jgi:hypothetical protein
MEFFPEGNFFYIHSVGTFRGTSSKPRFVEHSAWLLFVDVFAIRNVPRTGFLRTFHETSLLGGCLSRVWKSLYLRTNTWKILHRMVFFPFSCLGAKKIVPLHLVIKEIYGL